MSLRFFFQAFSMTFFKTFKHHHGLTTLTVVHYGSTLLTGNDSCDISNSCALLLPRCCYPTCSGRLAVNWDCFVANSTGICPVFPRHLKIFSSTCNTLYDINSFCLRSLPQLCFRILHNFAMSLSVNFAGRQGCSS